jgi:hypothetical protein
MEVPMTNASPNTNTSGVDPVVTRIDPTKFERAYSGRPGCMCGCLGDYKEDPKAIARIARNMMDRPGGLPRIDDEGIVYYMDRDDRYYALYPVGWEARGKALVERYRAEQQEQAAAAAVEGR